MIGPASDVPLTAPMIGVPPTIGCWSCRRYSWGWTNTGIVVSRSCANSAVEVKVRPHANATAMVFRSRNAFIDALLGLAGRLKLRALGSTRTLRYSRTNHDDGSHIDSAQRADRRSCVMVRCGLGGEWHRPDKDAGHIAYHPDTSL